MDFSTHINERIAQAVSFFWETRQAQSRKQKSRGGRDQGARSAATGGKQMDGFVSLVTELIQDTGVDKREIFYKSRLELPGFFRPEKKWDLLVVKDEQLIIALEMKSQVGPSFGNNFNNRAEEALGNALDLWTAYREGALNRTIRPWLGYLMLLEDCPGSRKPVSVVEPHFKVFPEFVNASYNKRYELFCRKLVRERHYNSTVFLTSEKDPGLKGVFNEPAEDLGFNTFARSIVAHVSTYRDPEKK